MVAETKVRLSGAWRLITAPEVELSGVSRAIQEIEVKFGGVWRTVFSAGTIPLVTDIHILKTGATGTSRAGIRFHDYRAGLGSDDGRILTKIHRAGTITTITDMGDDDTSPTPVDHTGEWTSDPVTESAWEVANTSISSGTFSFAHAAVGVYSTLDTRDMLWQKQRPGGPSRTPGTSQVIAQFRIREVADTANGTDFEVKLTAIQT